LKVKQISGTSGPDKSVEKSRKKTKEIKYIAKIKGRGASQNTNKLA